MNKIAVIGAGAIGSLVAAYLKLKNKDVVLIGTPESVKAIREKGLQVSGARGEFRVDIDVYPRLDKEYDLVILAVKTQDLEKTLKENSEFLKTSLVLTTQNGVQADEISSRYIPKENIISSIVMFGATYLEPGKVIHNFEGNWVIGNMFDAKGKNPPSPPFEKGGIKGGFINENKLEITAVLLNEVFPVTVAQDIRGMKFLKIFVNANNCIAAILGMSMQEAFRDLEVSRISIAIWKEGLDIIKKSGINLVSLPDFPVERLSKLAEMPLDQAAGIFSGIMANLSKEPLYGSILQSIKRGRLSEIDYINGEFVNLAAENSLKAPLNEKLVEMVHEVEKTNRFFSKEELVSAVGLNNVS
ncbi:MAG: 2-dehydropantoate 2-reductase [Candidatus Omnitrophota bacterium]